MRAMIDVWEGEAMAAAAQPWSARLAAMWGHLAPQALIVSIVGVILLRLNPPSDPTTALGVTIALITFVVASWLLMRRHDRGLCEHCMGAMPLNPSELAVRYRRRFWLSHSGAQPRYVVPYFAARAAHLVNRPDVDDLPHPRLRDAPSAAAVVPVVPERRRWRRG
jgi:hypothetical protein